MILPVLGHGADYNPDQWLDHPEILDQDIELMKKARVNIVSLGIFAWTALEPEEGRFNFDWMESIINRLYAAGVHVNLATPTAARPAWMAKKYPEVLRVNEQRQKQLYGDRHNHCYTSPIYREKTRIINQELAKRFGRHPAVVLWHINNEYGGECHCELCQQAFRDWLRARYGSIEAVNKAWNTAFWSHTYTAFDEIESPSPIGESSMLGLKLDWKRFVSHQTIDYFKWERDCVREIVPEAKVCVNMMYRFGGIDYFEMAKEVDLATWDSYPTWHKPGRTNEEIALDTNMMHDLYYSLKDQPFYLMESTPSYTNWQPITKVKKPGMAMFSGLSAIAHGSDSVMYFQWRQARGASEKFHGSVVSHDCREDNRVFVETAQLGEALAAISRVTDSRKEKQAAIVHDWNNMWAVEGSQGPRNAGMGYWEEIRRHYDGLSRNGFTVGFVNQDSDLTGYKLVVCPMLYMLREDFAAKLRDFTQNGGTLVVTYWSGMVDETDLCYLGDAPHNLTDVLGLRRTEIDGMYDGETRRAVAVSDAACAKEATGSALCEVAALEGAAPLMVYDEDFFAGSPAVAVNAFGEGRAYYIATRFEPAFYTAFYCEAGKNVLAPAWPGALPAGVMASRRGKYVFLQNSLSTPVKGENFDIVPYGTAVYEEKDGELTRFF